MLKQDIRHALVHKVSRQTLIDAAKDKSGPAAERIAEIVLDHLALCRWKHIFQEEGGQGPSTP